MITNAEGSRTTPSVVAFAKNGQVLVGEIAKRQTVTNVDRTIRSVKRHMGTDWTMSVDGKSFTPQQISAFILQKLKRDAESHLGEEVTDAVITVPAYFEDAQRQATKEAGQIAGLNVLRVVNEPTAAGLAYALDRGHKEQAALVLHFGGGTFEKLPADVKDKVKASLSEAQEALNGTDSAVIQTAIEKLATESQLLGQALYSETQTVDRPPDAAASTATNDKYTFDDHAPDENNDSNREEISRTDGEFRWDFFISYTKSGKAWAEWIK